MKNAKREREASQAMDSHLARAQLICAAAATTATSTATTAVATATAATAPASPIDALLTA